MSSDQIQLAFSLFEKVFGSLETMIVKPVDPDRGNIDASIQRFEFTIELFWKLLKRILESRGLEVPYPKNVLQAAYAGGLIDNEEIWLQMLIDRNQTSHTYNEVLANEIFERIKVYTPAFRKALMGLKALPNTEPNRSV